MLDKHFAQYRMYDAKLKRFMSEDPAKDGTNWYGYARNNPATYVDLLGLLTLSNNSYTHSSCKKATELIQRRLEHNGWWNRYKEEIDRNVTFPSHVGYGYFGEATVAVVNHFKKGVGLLSEWLGQAGVVDLTAWRYMNLPDAYFAADNSSVWNGRSAKSVYYEFYPDAKPSGSSSSSSGSQSLRPKPGLERLQDILPYPINYHTWLDGTRVTIWKDWSRNEADGRIGVYWADNKNIQILNGETYGKREYINAIVADYQRSQQPAQPQSYLNAPNFSNIDYLWATGALDLLNMLKYYQENYTDPKAHEYANMVRNEITRTQPYIEGVGETFGLPDYFNKIVCGNAYNQGNSIDITNAAIQAIQDYISAYDRDQLIQDLVYYITGVIIVAPTIKGTLGALTQAEIYRLATAATQNASSKIVVIGKYAGGTGYTKLGMEMGATYYTLNHWDFFYKILGPENMWKINELFIKLQLAAGKVFYASHNPANADGEFAKEVEFLLREGYRFIQEGEIWKFIK